MKALFIIMFYYKYIYATKRTDNVNKPNKKDSLKFSMVALNLESSLIYLWEQQLCLSQYQNPPCKVWRMIWGDPQKSKPFLDLNILDP